MRDRGPSNLVIAHASTAVRLLSRYRGALVGGIGSAVAVALTLDPATGLARSSVRFAFWFAMVATLVAVALTVVLMFAEYWASRPTLPRATARKLNR